MASCFSGSRTRRAATLGFLFACAIVILARLSHAQETVISDQYPGSDNVISDGGYSPTMYGGMPSGGDGGCYGGCEGNCDGYMPCDDCDACQPACNERQCCCSGWFSGEYLRWRIDGNRLPPLITAGPSNNPNAGQLDQFSTTVLSGNTSVNDDWRNGYRFSGGFWLDCCHTCGIGADYFNIGNDDYNYTSPQAPGVTVGRPFFNTQTGADDVQLVSVPNQLSGTATVRATDDFQGGGITLTRTLWRTCDPCCRGEGCGLSLLSGYRHYEYNSNLSITEDLTVLPGTTTPLVPGTTFLVQDLFRTQNEFNGGELGIQAYKSHCWWWCDGMAKCAIGSQRRTVFVNGQTVTDVPGGGTNTAAGGLLTSDLTNIGTYRDHDVVVIPEFRLGIGASVTKCCSIRAGYNVIYWGDVAHASAQLPPGLRVDPRNLPPTTAGGGDDPAFPGIHGSQLIAHGLDASVMFQW